MEYTNEQLEHAIAGLPEEFQGAIADSRISNKVQEIGKRYQLSVVQAGKLTDSAMLATLGLIDSANFSEVLSKDLVIELPQAQKIVEDIDKEVFDEIRKSIQEKDREGDSLLGTSLLGRNGEEKKSVDKPKEVIPEQEEILKREDVLSEIENPEPVGSIKEAGVSSKEEKVGIENIEQPADYQLPTTNYPLPTGNIAEQKLAQPFKIESKETEVKIPSIHAVKIDPYREAF